MGEMSWQAILPDFPDIEYEQALLLHDDDPEKPDTLVLAVQLFNFRYARSKNEIDLDKAISALDHAITLTPDGHPSQGRRLAQFGLLLLRRNERVRTPSDIDRAIFALECSIMIIPEGDADRPDALNNLGVALSFRFQQTGELIDINKAISAHIDAVRLTPDDHADKLGRLNNLGMSSLYRFKKTGELGDIDKATWVIDDVVRLTPEGHPNMPGYLNNLGNMFIRRFEHTAELIDVDKAISAHNSAVRLTPEGHADKHRYLSDLGNSLAKRCEHAGELVDINNAILAFSDAVRLSPEGYAGDLGNLGNAFALRFDYGGELGDIDKSIAAYNKAVRLTPEDHAHMPLLLTNLGSSFAHRFKHGNELVDINNSISALNEAVRLTHASQPMMLSNLGNSLRARFLYAGQLVDINNAISVQRNAVHLTHSNVPSFVSNFGISLTCRFERTGELVDVDQAISAHNDALRLTPEGHADKPGRMNNLGSAFLRRFERTREIVDIDNAISVLGDAVHLTPEGHAGRSRRISNLGTAFRLRFENTGDHADVEMAKSQFRISASSSPSPSIRLSAALGWARTSGLESALASLDGYNAAITLLPQVAWLGKTISARHKELASVGGIVNEAAAAAIESGQHETAVEWLERGRSIVWGQLLNLRTPVDELRDADHGLADDLVRISNALESASIEGDSSTSPRQRLSIEQTVQHHHQLAKDWDILVEKARTIPGFEDFLRPKKFAKLSKAARFGPVIMINVHKSRCDALILMSDLDEAIHVPLDSFSYDQAQQLQRSLNRSLSASGVRSREMRRPRLVSTKYSSCDFGEILSELWKCVVKPVLDALAFSVRCFHRKSSPNNEICLKISSTPDPPRIWWCATGPLTFLPIHAAGLYETNDAGFKISDFVTSSYIPTLTALLEQPLTKKQKFHGLLGVSQPCTPGLSRLPNAEKELIHIEQLSSSLNVHTLLGELATAESVVESMAECSWVHLACHAVQDTAEPTSSAFCLQNGHLTLSKIITKSFPHADFAFLSACQTATGDETVSEEAVHLAAGMLAAGYKSVIATMWSIMDEDAPLVAAEVYSHLVQGQEPDSTRAAHALHHAVRHLREKLEESGKSSFLSWVPFIHVGM
jgi:tetratricopeptide (TPR) repeat protein